MHKDMMRGCSVRTSQTVLLFAASCSVFLIRSFRRSTNQLILLYGKIMARIQANHNRAQNARNETSAQRDPLCLYVRKFRHSVRFQTCFLLLQQLSKSINSFWDILYLHVSQVKRVLITEQKQRFFRGIGASYVRCLQLPLRISLLFFVANRYVFYTKLQFTPVSQQTWTCQLFGEFNWLRNATKSGSGPVKQGPEDLAWHNIL